MGVTWVVRVEVVVEGVELDCAHDIDVGSFDFTDALLLSYACEKVMPSNIDDPKEPHYDLIVSGGLIRILIALIKYFAVFLLNDQDPSLLARFRLPGLTAILLSLWGVYAAVLTYNLKIGVIRCDLYTLKLSWVLMSFQ